MKITDAKVTAGWSLLTAIVIFSFGYGVLNAKVSTVEKVNDEQNQKIQVNTDHVSDQKSDLTRIEQKLDDVVQYVHDQRSKGR